MRGPEELADLLARRLVEAPGRHQVVDEEPVALVGRDPARRRVGLHEIALLLEHGHLVAHRCRRHSNPRRVGDVGRAHGLRRRDVLLHDCAQDRRLPIIEHAGSQAYRVLTARGGACITALATMSTGRGGPPDRCRPAADDSRGRRMSRTVRRRQRRRRLAGAARPRGPTCNARAPGDRRRQFVVGSRDARERGRRSTRRRGGRRRRRRLHGRGRRLHGPGGRRVLHGRGGLRAGAIGRLRRHDHVPHRHHHDQR